MRLSTRRFAPAQGDRGRGPSKTFVALMSARGVRLEARVAAIAALLVLSACHGSTLDTIYPGTLGHNPPPAFNLPPQDKGMEYR